MDHLNGKPVYKQEDGENYLYFNQDKNSWMVGTRVGDSYAWIKNESTHADSSSDESSSSDSSLGSDGGLRRKKRSGKKTRRVTPDLLESGWKYKPNGMELSTFSDDDTIWLEDDVTLKVEALKGELFLPKN